MRTARARRSPGTCWRSCEPKVPVHRMVFHEITREAIQRALQHTRDVDERLVDAQETRRILDRLYGYEVSPVLWRKVRAGLSAGRVQSVATRLVVERERERMAFRSASYWDLTGTFDPAAEPTSSSPPGWSSSTASGSPPAATSTTAVSCARRPARQERCGSAEPDAEGLVTALDGAAFAVRRVEEKPYRRRPAAPFTTSTLQQEAGRKLRFSSRQAMRVAQSLYENGHITYMRTDSTALSAEALGAARRQAAELYGSSFVPERPRVYPSKVEERSGGARGDPPGRGLLPHPGPGGRRAARGRVPALRADLEAHGGLADGRRARLDRFGPARRARLGRPGRRVRRIRHRDHLPGLPGRLRGGPGRGAQRGADEDAAPAAGADRGDALAVRDLLADGHETSPPPRYTEASLVKALEERGIGRPSTYAATISVIQDRGYVRQQGLGAGADLARVRRHPAAGGALRPAGRLRLHRRDGGRPRPDRRRRGEPGGLAVPLLLRRRVEGGRRVARG